MCIYIYFSSLLSYVHFISFALLGSQFVGYWLEVKVWLSGLGFLFWTSCRLAVWPGHFLSLCFSLLICQMGVLALWLVRLALCLQCAVRRSDELCCRNARYLANILCFSLICCCLLLEVDKYLLVHSSNSSRCKLGQVVSPFFLRQNPIGSFLIVQRIPVQ